MLFRVVAILAKRPVICTRVLLDNLSPTLKLAYVKLAYALITLAHVCEFVLQVG